MKTGGKPRPEKRAAHSTGGRTALVLLVVFVALALFSVAVDSWSTASLLRKVASVVTSDVAEGSAPVHPGACERSSVLLHSALDARWYVIHAETLLRTGAWRVRSTDLDNAPDGREVHWSSALVWAIVALAHLLSWFSGNPPLAEAQNAPFFLGPFLFVPSAALLAWLAGRRFGPAVAGFLVLLMATSFPIYDMFRAGEADHHGIATVLAMASVLSLVLGGAGVARREGKMPAPASNGGDGWFAMSGVFGATGMWISASTLIPVLAACGIGVVLAMAAARFSRKSLEMRPEVWWRWSLWGCGASLFFYLVEYFPFHMGWRLEVNHPLFAFAWLGGGFLLSRLGAKLAGGRFVETGGGWVFVFLAGCAVVAPVVVLRVFSTGVFVVADRFLLLLHSEYIREFAHAWVAYVGPDFLSKFADVFWWAVFAIAGLAVVVVKRGVIPASWRPQWVLLFTVTLLLQVEALVQIRWAGLSVGLWVLCVTWLAGLHGIEKTALRLPRPVVAAFLVWAVLGVAGFPLFSIRAVAALKKDTKTLPKMMVPTILLRDIAHRIAEASPDRLPVVLSDPTSSTDLAFYGGVRVVGTLYWENMEGLKRSARIFSATTEAEARQLMESAGVTHLVMPSWDSFADLSAYSGLLERSGELQGPHGESFLAKVIDGRKWPQWMRPVHYAIPKTFGLEGAWVKIFEVLPGQTPFEAARSRGVYHAEAGEYERAIRALDEALELKPDDADIPRWISGLRAKVQGRKRQPASTSP